MTTEKDLEKAVEAARKAAVYEKENWCETCQRWDSNLKQGMCSWCRDKYEPKDYEQK